MGAARQLLDHEAGRSARRSRGGRRCLSASSASTSPRKGIALELEGAHEAAAVLVDAALEERSRAPRVRCRRCGKVAAPSSSSGRSVGSRARQAPSARRRPASGASATAAPRPSVSGSSTQKRLSDSTASRSVPRSARPGWKASDSTQATNSASEARSRSRRQAVQLDCARARRCAPKRAGLARSRCGRRRRSRPGCRSSSPGRGSERRSRARKRRRCRPPGRRTRELSRRRRDARHRSSPPSSRSVSAPRRAAGRRVAARPRAAPCGPGRVLSSSPRRPAA